MFCLFLRIARWVENLGWHQHILCLTPTCGTTGVNRTLLQETCVTHRGSWCRLFHSAIQRVQIAKCEYPGFQSYVEPTETFEMFINTTKKGPANRQTSHLWHYQPVITAEQQRRKTHECRRNKVKKLSFLVQALKTGRRADNTKDDDGRVCAAPADRGYLNPMSLHKKGCLQAFKISLLC